MKSIINFLIFIYSIVKVFSNEFRKLAETKENRVLVYYINASNSSINFAPSFAQASVGSGATFENTV